ncbi:BspA family leucine-rich repeat surface protein [Flagellimonas sp. CMM7]|uniref:BspA family leucine-rich repeat surface protein n=1 Tax=Flagellimonas sp. CMM7 TaxID=2654676 RepID=UPI0013D7D918|nr:BspA family leucine-rich repeat surface protein [Flagellimonas sp. CMM7]UII79249.1 BspA family leucine-rich repeat surface protein [Flagellimonas sp. CMM7]
MKIKSLLFSSIPALILLSCSNDDDGHTRGIPVINPQTFEISEAITNSEIIGNVYADDPNGDPLTFRIGLDKSNLFTVSKSGELRLINGKNLDFETAKEHKFTVRVTDGTGEFFNYVTVMVLDENETAISDESFFTVNENISDTFVIGKIMANDPENDVLSFEILVNDNDLFEITKDGELSLASGKALDFEMGEEHKIIVQVSDGNTASMAEVTITVIDGVDIVDQTFEVPENIGDMELIGTVTTSNPQNEFLTFEIVTNDNNLFNITDDGKLSLESGESLDFETSKEHRITISVTDGIHNDLEAEVTIIVADIVEADPLDVAAFVTTWKTSNDMESIGIGVNPNLTYDYTINWGDGTVEDIANSINPEHTYDTAGTYTVAIVGDFPQIEMFLAPNHQVKLSSIDQWGSIRWRDLNYALAGCPNMIYNATDVPDLSMVTDLSNMFRGDTSFNGDIANWDVSNITNMRGMFAGASSFNRDLDGWDVGSVTDMSEMFLLTESFNGDLSGWDLHSVLTTQGMFAQANAFNQDLSNWDVGSVILMNYMFSDANAFNQDLSNWDVSSVTHMTGMFQSAELFDRSLGAWNLNSITTMFDMFSGGAGLSPENYDATLIGWNANINTPDNISFGAIGINYCSNFAAAARGGLTVNKGWTITDDGQNCNP